MRRRRWGVLVLVWVGLVMGAASPARAQQVDEGTLQMLRERVAEQPLEPRPRRALAQALAGAGQLDAAIGHMRIAIELQPRDAGAFLELGNMYWAQGKFDWAERAFRMATLFNPALEEAHALRAAAAQEQAKTQPQDSAPVFREGLAYLDHHDYAAAIGAFREAYRLNPQSTAATFHLALALEYTGENREAISLYAETVRLMPEHDDGWLYWGSLLAKDGDVVGATTVWQELLDRPPTKSQTYRKLAKQQRQYGLVDAAIATYRAGAERWPDDTATHHGLLQTLLAAGRYAEGLRHIEKMEVAALVLVDPQLRDALEAAAAGVTPNGN